MFNKFTVDVNNVQKLLDEPVDQGTVIKTTLDKAGNDIKSYLNTEIVSKLNGVFVTPAPDVSAMAVQAYNGLLNSATNIKDLGAKGNANYYNSVNGKTYVDAAYTIESADDTAIFAAAFANPNIKALYIPTGKYKISGTGTEIFLLTRAIKLYGDGALNSVFALDPSIPSTTDIIRIAPTVGMVFCIFEDFGMENLTASASILTARHSIHIDLTSPTAFFAKSMINRCIFSYSNGASIKLTNPTNTDGFFTSSITNNIMYGGIDLERSGDSVTIEGNQIAGSHTGIKITTVTGAMRTLISENNITTANGAMILTDVSQISIKNNQMEAVGTKISQDSVIMINGGNNITIEENNLDTLGNIANCININNTVKSSIDKNSMNILTANMHIIVGSGAKDTYIGYKNVPRKDGIISNNLAITNNGIGTTNVDVNLTLLNGWVGNDSATYGLPRISKTADGIVTLKGQIKSGTTSFNTIMFVLPQGFIPKAPITIPCFMQSDASTYLIGRIRIDASGEFYFQTGSNFLLDLNSISFKADYFGA